LAFRETLGPVPTLRVLEPSAGTGSLLRAAQQWERLDMVAVEIEPAIARVLGEQFKDVEVICADFLSLELGQFDRIVMNPPFANGADIRHIEHARKHLKPGGRLVAICANGPRQQARLMPEASEWHELPADAFKESGTTVNAAIVIIDARY